MREKQNLGQKKRLPKRKWKKREKEAELILNDLMAYAAANNLSKQRNLEGSKPKGKK